MGKISKEISMTQDDPLQNKTWSGRFSVPVSEAVKQYTASVSFDQRLALHDIQGSLAHARMLSEVGILSTQDFSAIESGLTTIADDIQRGTFTWNLDDEDVHLNIEKRLTERIGDAGKRLHTGRSRNDQVATDIRLYLRESIDHICQQLRFLQQALLALAEPHVDTIMPGFTHLQVAQPVSLAHHLMAYVEMFSRDHQRLLEIRHRVNQLPLGAAALAGTSYPLRRERVAELLGFEGVCNNSLDAVSDRDFAIEFCSAAALIMIHLSRLSEELILWMSPRFAFVRIGDAFCTGSSIMPQKRNPDVPELVRGKSGRVTGHLMGLLMLMKAQPLAYNKDNQEDKEPLFDTVDTLTQTLRVYTDMMRDVHINPSAMNQAAREGFSTATDLADYLVKKGTTFRDAHEIVARAVRHAEDLGCDLADLPLTDLQSFSASIENDIYSVLTLEGSVASRHLIGGTAPSRVRAAIARKRLELDRA
jgi:argininosuccinate lyase (EC 4.3.2.1)